VNKTLTVLAVDDEAPALDELAYPLGRHPDIGQVYRAGDTTSALRELNGRNIDAIFLDINMPGLSGIELAGVLANFSNRPAVVFVTAHDDKAVAAFDVGAIDYLLKPAGPRTATTTPTSSRPSSAASRIWCHETASAG
jgi:DNA-binding LytR/AlgR family response regulator